MIQSIGKSIYDAQYNTQYASLDEYDMGFREYCHKSDGTIITCSNLGKCVICQCNFTSAYHVISEKKIVVILYVRYVMRILEHLNLLYQEIIVHLVHIK